MHEHRSGRGVLFLCANFGCTLFFTQKVWYNTSTYEKEENAMAYADQLYEVVDKYFVQIIMPYGVKNNEAGRYLKKFMPFKRKNFDEYIEAYEKFSEAAQILTMENIEVPEDDEKAQYLKECFYQSQKTFCKLCERNIALYEFQNRKEQRKEIGVQELKNLFVGVQASMNSAGRDIDALEKAYKDLRLDTDPEYAKAVAEEKAAAEKAAQEKENRKGKK